MFGSLNNSYRHFLITALYIALAFLIWMYPDIAKADTAEDIYQEISLKYPLEISTLQDYGGSETKLKEFISAFEQSLIDCNNLTEDNFQEQSVIILLDLYFSGDHSRVFDAVFNGWNLSSDMLINAYSQGGTDAVMDLLPRSFSEIGRLVKQIIFPSSDVTGDNLIDIYDLVLLAHNEGTSSEDLNFIRRFDLNRDSKIDIEDIVKAAIQYGQRP